MTFAVEPRFSVELARRLAGGLCVALVVLACEPAGDIGDIGDIASGAASAHAASASPDIVLITLDTTRADHLGSYGYFRPTSPNLDALALESLVFERHVTPMATTLPTHTSILTGTYPTEHGVVANLRDRHTRYQPAAGLRSFAEHLRDRGYRTAAFVSATPLKAGSGVEAGFAVFDQPEEHQRRADQTSARALAWLSQARGSAPLFLWVHYFDPHSPYAPPPSAAGRFTSDASLEAWLATRGFAEVGERARGRIVETRDAVDGYDSEIRFMDEQIGELLAALRERPSWPRTAVVVAGDHGESLGQHGEAGHGLVWAEQLHSPLMMRVPGRAAARYAGVISSVDVLPTLLGMLSVPQADAWLAQTSGRDALATGSAPRHVLSQSSFRRERFGTETMYSLTGRRWKYVRGSDGRELLFDHDADPYELNSVHAEQPELLANFRDELAAVVADQRARAKAIGAGKTAPIDAEVLEQLEQLGYVEE